LLINEDIDQNLKITGSQLLILTAGSGSYRVNPGMVSPTKDRIILGGLPILMISFAQQPPYKTPLFISSQQYENPFSKDERDIKTGTGREIQPYTFRKSRSRASLNRARTK
jgi:hypothetical protein